MDLLDAIGQFGTAADKITGGRALRGALAGKPRELASIIPFSDSMGLTNVNDATSGRDLTDAYGITSKSDASFHSHALGFLADNALSPGNLLGAYGAFKAAPTIAKGVTAGAKALSGLDLLDHLKGIGSAAKGFMRGDSGALKVPTPHIDPLPVNTEAMQLNSAANNASRPRRFSTDPAKQKWYSQNRQERFSQRFMGAPRAAQSETVGTPFGMPSITHEGFLPAWLDRPYEKSIAEGGLAPWQSAAAEGNKFGIDVKKYSPGEMMDLIKQYDYPSETYGHMHAFYDHNQGHIGLNGALRHWDNPEEMASQLARAHGESWLSSSHPNTLIHHEIGHHLHAKHAGDYIYNSLDGMNLSPEHEDLLSRLVSRYSATSPHEAVAEIVGPLLHGHKFDQGKALSGPLLRYGGTNLYQYLGDNGYLKGLGLSALGMLSAGLNGQTAEGTNMAGLDLGLGNLNPVKPGDFDFDLGLGGARPRTRAQWRVPLPGEQEQSLTQKALGMGTSGLSYIGGTLDKPGQAVRGLLAGKGVGSLKHLVPFSDTLGLTGEADHISGRDLTDMAGITDKRDKGWGAWGAGLAADMATDPLSYLTLGSKHALTAAGLAAKKAGTLKGLTRVDMLKKGYSGLAGFGAPFANPSAVVGTGRTAQRFAGVLDRVGDKLKYGTTLGRWGNQLFDPDVADAVHEITQRGYAKHGAPAMRAEKEAARAHAADVLQDLSPRVKAGNYPETEITGAARALAEGVPAISNYDPALVAQSQGLAGKIGARNDVMLNQIKQAGGPLEELNDRYANYVYRQPIDITNNGMQLRPRNGFYPVAAGSNLGRDKLLANIPGGSDRLNNWAKRFAGDKNTKATTAAIRQDLESDLLAHAGGHQMTPELAKEWDGVAATPGVKGVQGKAQLLAERMASLDPKYRPTAENPAGLDFFSPDLARTEIQRGSQNARTLAAIKASTGTMADAARPYVTGSDMVPLSEVAKRIGLRTSKADPVTGAPMQGALVQLHDMLAKRYGLAPANLNGKIKAVRQVVNQYGLTAEHAAQLLQAHNKWMLPEPLKGPLAFMDSLTNAFKGLSYPIWIPSHVRNVGTALGNNARSGTGFKDMGVAKGIIEGSIDPARLAQYGLKNLDEARKAPFVSAGIFGGHGISDDIADSAMDALTNNTSPGRFTPHAPGEGRENFLSDTLTGIPRGWAQSIPAIGQTAKNLIKDPLAMAPWNIGSGRLSAAFNPIAIKGVGGATKDMLPAVKAGRMVGTNVEDMMRLSQWLAEVRQGASHGAAGEAVNKMHFDYDHLSSFEKNVMRKLVPFYTYARKNLPLQIETALHTPAWTQAQIKPFNQPSEDKGYVPDYMQSGVSIPTGPEVDGKRQYISKLGLPAEEAFERLHFNGGLPDVGRTVMDYMGQLNPLIKGPMEQLFDKQFHTQRNLSDLHAPKAASAIGRLFGDDNPQLLSQILSNTPLTRFMTSADKLLDERKGWLPKATNLLTGVRVSDVDTEKQRAIDSRNALEEILKGQPHLSKYTSFYVKPSEAANLTPQEVELMRLYSTYQQNARDYAKAQKQKIGVRLQP